MKIDTLKTVLKSHCECEDGGCPYCEIANHLESIKSVKEESRDIKKANKSLVLTHQRHLSGLQVYYHKLHKECPCLNEKEPGKCRSPWRD